MGFYVKANAAEAINADLNMTKLQSNKALFVKSELSAAVKRADTNIHSLEYWVCDSREYVSIHYNNGYEASIRVDGNSLTATARDIFDYIICH